MTSFKLTRRGFIAGSAAAAALASSRPLRAATPATEVRYRSYLTLDVLDPAYRESGAEGEVIDAIFRGLISYTPGDTWGWELDAAEEFELLDDTHIRFALKDGLGWSDGHGPLTAEDVKFSFERIANPDNVSPYRNDWAALDRVDVTEERAGTIVLSRPFVPLLSTTLPAHSGYIVCKRAVEALDGARFGNRPPAVLGPYEIEEVVDRQWIAVRRRDNWGGPPAGVDRIVFRTIVEDNAAEIAYSAGELDVAGIPVTAISRYRRETPPETTLLARPNLQYMWLGMQMEEGVFADPRVRQAVQHAIDVDAIIDGAFFGEAVRATGLVAPGLIGHREANLVAGPDRDKARALLAEAGYPNGFRTDIKVRNSSEFLNPALIAAASLAEVGIDVEVVPLDNAVMRNYGAGPNGEWRELAMYIGRFSMNPDPSWATEWFTSDQIGEWNYSRFANEEFDSLHAEATGVSDEARRHEMYVRMQDLMEESGAFVFLVHGTSAVLHRNSVNPVYTPDGARAMPHRFTVG